MAFKDALQDTVTISAITVADRAGSNIGEQVKTAVVIYNGVKCRLMNNQNQSSFVRNAGSYQSEKENWLILMEPQYNGANRGDRAVVGGKTYLITKKHEIRGDSSAIHHVVYYLEEQT